MMNRSSADAPAPDGISAFRAALKSGFIFLDGSMGALLQSRRAESGDDWKTPEALNLTKPDLIREIHAQYLDAGANVILTNTFGGCRVKLAEYGLDPAETVASAVRIAREAVAGRERAFVALDIGPTGKLLEPMGGFTFDEAYETFAEMARAGEAAGADLAVIETMSDLYELKAAVLAVKENTALPIIASATFQDTDRTLTGADPATVVATMEGLGVDAVGFNCGGDLAHARALADEFLRWASVPVFMEPNAGIPVVENGKTVFKVGPAEFADALEYGARQGVRILGGCCGTTPGHIAAMVARAAQLSPLPIGDKGLTVVSSWSQALVIGAGAGLGSPACPVTGPVIVGERINPTGKKKFREAILANDIDYVLGEGKAQLDAGAHVLDVNVGLPGIDEGAIMLDAVHALQRTYPAPLQIDSSEPAVLERALRYYNGKALVNSVNGKAHVMAEVFPIVKKYGGVLVALALDEQGIPPTAEGRLAVARKIVETAEAHGIPRKNIIVDTLTLTVSSQQKEAMETVRAIPLVKENLGVKTILGVSNISFGLPQRELVNSVFFAAALNAGLDACIINPLSAQMMAVWRSYRALSGHDENCLSYIDAYSNAAPLPVAQTGGAQTQSSAAQGSAPQSGRAQAQAGAVSAQANATTQTAAVRETAGDDLHALIVNGLRDRSRAAAERLLQEKTPIEIIDGYIVPALDEVGKDFERGKKFLPQLLLSADTVSRAFEAIKAHLARTGEKTEPKGKILIATVSGDIHDIGKNIVKAMLENYGYAVIDLGKDVPIETVIERAKAEKPGIVGLSALMTTTVASMERTIARIRAEGLPVRVMVGGAVLTPEYASRIGADFFARDAMASVGIAREVFGK
jgi:5-methyltetrahydrofolate--homocysteine methyltransferase